jgi:hypothetical protein
VDADPKEQASREAPERDEQLEALLNLWPRLSAIGRALIVMRAEWYLAEMRALEVHLALADAVRWSVE